ncbi:hypothetical protein DV737_g5642, partial [Chaetothyriales sp. CBS 132003]
MQNPSLTLNTPSQTRHQVPLRDYLNTRIAPFLKEALTESLDKEPEYPLQWLGECLINQSILYEGNTEAEKLKEHFRYTFPPPAHEETATTNGQETNATRCESAEAALPTLSEPTAVQPAEPPTGQAAPLPPAEGDGQDTEMGGTT